MGHDFSWIPARLSPTSAVPTKLAVAHPGDPLEREADRLAELVSTMPEAPASRPRLSRFNSGANGRHAEPMAAPPEVGQVVNSPGQPLPRTARGLMEERFGCDFSAVRVHADAAAEQSARAVNARAYTVGRHIVFGAGGLSHETREGGRLLAHELAHVVQQSGGAAAAVQRQPRQSNPDDERARVAAEAEAEAQVTTDQLEAQSEAEDALKLNWRRRADKSYAWKIGLKDKGRLQATHELSLKFQRELVTKLHFFQGEAKAAYLRTIGPTLAGFPSDQVGAILSASPGAGAETTAGETAGGLTCDAGQWQFPMYDEADPAKSGCVDVRKDQDYLRNYFDDNIKSAVGYAVEGTTWENVDYDRFNLLLVHYRNGSAEYFILNDIGNFSQARGARIIRDPGYLKRPNGLIYPINNGQIYFHEQLTPNIISYKNGLRYQAKQLQDLYQLLQVAGAHASILGAYGAGVGSFKASIKAFQRSGPARLPGRPLPGRITSKAPQGDSGTGQQTSSTGGSGPPSGAVSTFTDHFAGLVGKPFSPGGTQIKVGGVNFGGVNAFVRNGQLVVTYSHIINSGRVPGEGRAMHAAFEQAGVQLARRLGLPSVKVAVSTVINPRLADHLSSLGYSKQGYEITPRNTTFWLARDISP